MVGQLDVPLVYGRKPVLTQEVFRERLLAWYGRHRRVLPWRQRKDPYAIWLSEVILQQTRVAQGLPYYERFLERYPTVRALAAAQEEQVLRLWQGLGYYTRARKMHACARHVVEQLGGVFPTTYEGLRALPGVGLYTAAAVASIAYGVPVAVVDGNVYRVLARLWGMEDDISASSGQKVFRARAQALVPEDQAGVYNQALMEFGALQCTPAQPRCGTCLFADVCVAFHSGKVRLLPVKKRRVSVKERYFHYLVLQGPSGIYFRKREEQDIWRGLYEFYMVECARGLVAWEALEDALVEQLRGEGVTASQPSRTYVHKLTHQRLHSCFVHVDLGGAVERSGLLAAHGLHPYQPAGWEQLPKSVLVARFCQQVLSGLHTL